MTLTLNIHDELAAYLPTGNAAAAAVMEAGMRRLETNEILEIHHLSDLLELLARLPSPAEVLESRPSRELTDRTEQLLQLNRESGLNEQEHREWASILKIEHLMRLAKANAFMRMSSGK